MREVFADFMHLQDLPDGQRRIRLSVHRVSEEQLQPDEHVWFVEYGQLRAPTEIQCREENGQEHWYSVLSGPIEDLIEVG